VLGSVMTEACNGRSHVLTCGWLLEGVSTGFLPRGTPPSLPSPKDAGDHSLARAAARSLVTSGFGVSLVLSSKSNSGQTSAYSLRVWAYCTLHAWLPSEQDRWGIFLQGIILFL